MIRRLHRQEMCRRQDGSLSSGACNNSFLGRKIIICASVFFGLLGLTVRIQYLRARGLLRRFT
jgi:hypothetical protein